MPRSIGDFLCGDVGMAMMRLVTVFLFLTVGLCMAQLRYDTECTLRVDVIFASGGHAPGGLRVQLLQGMNSSPIAVTMTGSSGNAEFDNVGAGSYTVLVTGDGVQRTQSGVIEIESGKVFASQTVAVRASSEGEHHTFTPAVSAVDLNVPKEASKEFDRASKELAHENWNKAIEHLNKAIVIYPQYSSAYNNLAICYQHLGQKDRQREVLQKAIAANDHCVPAMVNLADMDVTDHNLPEANTMLNRAIAADPNNLEALALMVRVDFIEGHYDQVIAAAHKIHAMSHGGYAMVHYTAASAFEHEGRIPDAIAELQIFLQEQPNGPRADAVRKAIPEMQKEAK